MSAEPEGRAVLIARLRELATWLEDHPAIPVSPYAAVTVSRFTDDPAELSAAMQEAPGGWTELDGGPAYAAIIEHGHIGNEWSVYYQLAIRAPKPEPES